MQFKSGIQVKWTPELSDIARMVRKAIPSADLSCNSGSRIIHVIGMLGTLEVALPSEPTPLTSSEIASDIISAYRHFTEKEKA